MQNLFTAIFFIFTLNLQSRLYEIHPEKNMSIISVCTYFLLVCPFCSHKHSNTAKWLKTKFLNITFIIRTLHALTLKNNIWVKESCRNGVIRLKVMVHKWRILLFFLSVVLDKESSVVIFSGWSVKHLESKQNQSQDSRFVSTAVKTDITSAKHALSPVQGGGEETHTFSKTLMKFHYRWFL